MALLWSCCAHFVNEEKSGSVTFHFDKGVIKGRDEFLKIRF